MAFDDRIKFFLHPDDGVYILPKLPASALRGMLQGYIVTAHDHGFQRSRTAQLTDTGLDGIERTKN